MEGDGLMATQNEDSGEHNDSNRDSYSCSRSFLSEGIFFALCGTLFLTGGDICATLLTRSVSPLAILAMFSPISAAVSLIFAALLRVPLPDLRTMVFVLLPCNLASCACRTFLLGAVRRILVGDAISIFYTTPVFAAVFGWMLLKQSLKMSDFIFSSTCIVGVIFVTQPSFVFSQIVDGTSKIDNRGIMFGVGAAVCNGLFVVLVRKLSDLGVHYAVIVSSTECSLFVVSASLCTLLKDWRLPEPSYYTVFIPSYAFFVLLASFCIFYAVSKERAVYVTVILTSEIVLVYVYQSLSMNAAPDWLTIIGAIAVIVSCVGIAFSENSDGAGD